MPTFVPEWLAKNLVASGLSLGDILGVSILLDLAIGVLDIAAMLVESCHFHCFFNGEDVDSRQGVEIGESAARDGHSLIRYRCARRTTRSDGR